MESRKSPRKDIGDACFTRLRISADSQGFALQPRRDVTTCVAQWASRSTGGQVRIWGIKRGVADGGTLPVRARQPGFRQAEPARSPERIGVGGTEHYDC